MSNLPVVPMDDSQVVRGVGPDVNLANPSAPQAQPDVPAPALDMNIPGGQQSMASNVAQAVGSQANVDPHVSKWRAVLQGALAGLAGGIPGVIVGATQGAANPKQTFRAIGQQQALQQSSFDMQQARAANSVAVAAQNAFTASKMPEEWQHQQNQRGLAQIESFRNIGVSPIRVIDDSDEAANNTLKDLMEQGGGKIPSVYTVHIAGQNGAHGQIAVYDLAQITNAPSAPGIVNETAGYANRPPVSQELWAKMSPSDRQEAVSDAMAFWNPTPSSSANAQALINRYQSLQRAWGIAHRGESNYDSVMSQFSDTVKHLQTGLKGWDDHSAAQKAAQAEAAAQAKKAHGSAHGNTDHNLYEGTDQHGNQVAGTAAELDAAGVRNYGKMPALTQTQTLAARELTSPEGLFAMARQQVLDLQKRGKLGVVASRYNDFWAGKGVDADMIPLRDTLSLIATKLMQAHMGNRGGKDAMEHFAALVPAGSTAQVLMAALNTEHQYVSGLAKRPRKAVQ